MNIFPSKAYKNFSHTKYLCYQSFSIIYLNIRSLRKNFDQLIVSLNDILENIDVIILVETNISDEENDLYKINGFKSDFLNRID